jgi:hypothetical protein
MPDAAVEGPYEQAPTHWEILQTNNQCSTKAHKAMLSLEASVLAGSPRMIRTEAFLPRIINGEDQVAEKSRSDLGMTQVYRQQPLSLTGRSIEYWQEPPHSLITVARSPRYDHSSKQTTTLNSLLLGS